FESTGGLLEAADCQTGHAVSATATNAGVPLAPLDRDLPVRLFGNASQGRTGRLDDTGSRDPALHAWDCSAPPLVDKRDAIDGPLGSYWPLNHALLPGRVSQPAPSVGDPGGSLYDPMNETEYAAVWDCSGKSTSVWILFVDYPLERDQLEPTGYGHDHADFVF